MSRPPMDDTPRVLQYLCDQVERIAASLDGLQSELAQRCADKEARLRALEINGSARRANQAWLAWLLKWIVLPTILAASTFAGAYLARQTPATPPDAYPAVSSPQ